jgi:hypothetical protein
MDAQTVPPTVRNAVLAGNRLELARLSRKGKEVKVAKKQARLNRMILEAEQMLRQGNEHICPIDD